MTSERARQILLLYRGEASESNDPEIKAALALAETDPELKRWLEAHLSLHSALRKKLRGIEVPLGAKEALLARRKVVALSSQAVPWWTRPPVWAIATVLLLVGVLAALIFAYPDYTVQDRYAQFQSRMVGTVLRQYRMDIVTNDMAQVRRFMAAKGAPADYEVRPALARLQLTGGGALKWQNNPVAMVCFDRGDKQMLYLFVTKRTAVEPPPGELRATKVSELLAVSWSEGDKTYMLAGPEEPDFLKKYVH